MRYLVIFLTLAVQYQAAASDFYPSEGVIWHSFENSCVGCDNTFISNDYFSYSLNGNELTFSQLTNFYNGHICSIGGKAFVMSEKSYEYIYQSYDDSEQCRFRISFDSNGVNTSLVDGSRACMDCGVRGSIYNSFFPKEGLGKSPFLGLSNYDFCKEMTWNVDTNPYFSDGMFEGILEADVRGLTPRKCADILLSDN